MELIINQVQKTFESEVLTVQQLLDIELPEKQKGVAVAIEQEVVPKTLWETTLLQPNQNIIIIKATQGG